MSRFFMAEAIAEISLVKCAKNLGFNLIFVTTIRLVPDVASSTNFEVIVSTDLQSFF